MGTADSCSITLGNTLPENWDSDSGHNPSGGVSWIRQTAMFHTLSRRDIAEIVNASKQRRFALREPIFCEDDPVCFVFIIIAGRVKVTRFSRGGKEIILRINGPGEIVDELSLAAGSSHRFTAFPIEICQLLVWELRTFQTFMQRFPALQLNISNILGSRLNTLQQHFCHLATERVPQRLARTLVGLAQQQDSPADNTIVGLSCEELAQMIGTTVFTVSRLLSQWTEYDLIRTERKSILIDNLPGLSKLAEGEDA